MESVVGAGSIFNLYLPEVEAGASERRDERRDPNLRASGAGRRVLVVEDNVEVGRFSTQVLQDLGFKTTWATNAEEALQLIGETGEDFDVVFSDVVMPGMGGVELAKILKAKLPKLPVILASGYRHMLVQEGTHGFELLQKPYSAEQLSRKLRRANPIHALGQAQCADFPTFGSPPGSGEEVLPISFDVDRRANIGRRSGVKVRGRLTRSTPNRTTTAALIGRRCNILQVANRVRSYVATSCVNSR